MQKVMCRLYNTRRELIFAPDYPDGTKPTSEEIVKCLTEEHYVGKFNKDEYQYSDGIKITSDENLHITKDDNNTYVWLVYMDGVHNVNYELIPGLYYVRKIGIIVDVGEK